jgi:aryl-alcohol dehydrogenase-like predicted oxidoreductase
LRAGINFFDTANIYSQGTSEEIRGRALRQFANRDEVVIATTLRHPMRSGPNGSGLSRKAILAELDHSLKRLGVDYVDLYQIHRADPDTPIEETLEALGDVVKAGKVRYLGASSMRAFEFAKALHLQRHHNWPRFVSMQDHYNLLAREEEREMIPLCLDEGVGTLIWSPLARGRLARSWANSGQTRRAREDSVYTNMLYPPATEAADRLIIDAVGKIAQSRSVSRAQIALAWLHSKPVVSAPIIGATKTEHIDDAVASLDIQLTAEEVAALERPYTPRHDFQGVSDSRQLAAIAARIPGFTTADSAGSPADSAGDPAA